MVGALVLIATLALGPGGGPGGENLTLSEAVAFHVRTTDPRVQAWLRMGAAESQTFRNLLNALAESDLIVHVQVVDRLPTAGQTYFVTSTATMRYVRIEVMPGLMSHEMIALIGHELQHAVEIAQERQIRDRQGLSLYYRSLPGNSTSSTEYDSVAARLMEDRVRREMAGAGRSVSYPPVSTLAEKTRYKRGPDR